ncbi:ATP-binding cassette domain-containing protein [Ottowia sp. GY511]|uniref:Dual specificity protein phosphatase family protein n=1 Tax=Ottowia flava TaxID=2675430 RepID=A0ABW4KNX5_9BURK|nr:dual specificity protein phosphatase family protein [Ottowia sp. GY511]TXK28273.1 ATP-binding cassette domain-containing protein [Ottowia sp. GY511]
MSALQLSGFGVCFGHRVILSNIDLELPAQGVDVLMGPVKTGKSTLMRTLAGLNACTTIHRHWGCAKLADRPVGAGWRPTLVQQHAALFKSSVQEAVLAQSAPATRAQRDEAAREALQAHGLGSIANGLRQSVLELPVHQQRAINILAHALPCPPLLMVDEPTYGLPPDAAQWLVDWLRALGDKVRLLVVLHHQGQARRLADRVVLLGGGVVLAHGPNPRFFTHPVNDWVRQFALSGSLSVASPDAREEDLDPSVPPPPRLPQAALDAVAEFTQRPPPAAPVAAAVPPPSPRPPPPVDVPALASIAVNGHATTPPARHCASTAPMATVGAALPPLSRTGVETASMVGKAIMTEYRGPHGFHWIIPGTLAGCGEPGAMAPIDYDMQLLANLGISHLVTLTENDIDENALERNGLKNIHLPIFDREAPSVTQAYMLVRRMQLLLDQGHVIAVHCKAGIGRTGTILAAWLIREGGLSASDAIARLRNIHTYYVQTREQEVFLERFEQDILKRT